MKLIYIDCASGISGDKFIAAMTDLLDAQDYLQSELTKLHLEFSTEFTAVSKCETEALHFNVHFPKQDTHRYLNDIFNIIDASTLSDAVKQLSKDIFLKIGEAEAKAHDVPIEKVHFHEVGAIDSIIDIVSAAVLLDKLGEARFIASPVGEGIGKVTYSHGETLLPVPAVRHILKDAPTKRYNLPSEMTTPTGAAILATITDNFQVDCPFSPSNVGKGAGTKDFPFPNILTISLYQDPYEIDTIKQLTTTIDDMNPEFYQPLITHLLACGAIDVQIYPSIAKKHRHATTLQILSKQNPLDALLDCIFKHSSTIGVRVTDITRYLLKREIRTIKTKYGDIRAKVVTLASGEERATPEYEDCKKAAEKHDVSILTIYDEAKLKYSR
ncbi:nickel pincer cofactor biosynthesis protein LarC [Candidatus Woesearchaeota archaeon]|nr:nickel pincer cofactor biosynthesis protein LarC [Candidatus Woesearchaeota archaeon]